MRLWIARDKGGELYLYDVCPERRCVFFWIQFGYTSIMLDENMFPEVTWENSPQEVELKLVNEIVGVAESPLKTFPRVNEFEVGASYRR